MSVDAKGDTNNVVNPKILHCFVFICVCFHLCLFSFAARIEQEQRVIPAGYLLHVEASPWSGAHIFSTASGALVVVVV